MLSKFKQILEKLKNPHIVNLIGTYVMAVLNVVQLSIVYRYLSKDTMGVWFFFQGTIGLLDTFRAGLITTAFVTSYSGSTKERTAEVAGSAWFLSLLITGVFIIANLIYLVIPYHAPDPSLHIFLKWFGVVFIITLPSFIASCVLQAEQRFDRLLYIRCISTILSIIIIIGLAVTKNLTLMTVIYSGFISGGVSSLISIVFGWARINTIFQKTTGTVKALFAFGKYSVGTNLGSNMFRYSDTFIINFMLGPGSLAVYNMGLRLMELVEVPLRSFAATVMPPLSAAFNQDNKYHVIYLLKKYSGMLTIILIPVVIGSLFFAEVAIWLIDKKYLTTEAANVLRIFMTFALLYPVERFMALTLDAINQPRVNMIKLIFMLTANIVGDLAGVWITGNIYGVALATILPILTGLLISYNWLQRYMKFSLIDVYKVGWLETQWLIKDALAMVKGKKENPPSEKTY